MNSRISGAAILSALITAWGLSGCSTPQNTEQALNPPPPEISRALPLEPPPKLAGQVCKLGSSCMELDQRPFEACLVGTKQCVDKALEPIAVQGPKSDGASPDGPFAVSKR